MKICILCCTYPKKSRWMITCTTPRTAEWPGWPWAFIWYVIYHMWTCPWSENLISKTAGWIVFARSSIGLYWSLLVQHQRHLPIRPLWAYPWARYLIFATTRRIFVVLNSCSCVTSWSIAYLPSMDLPIGQTHESLDAEYISLKPLHQLHPNWINLKQLSVYLCNVMG